MDEGFMIDSPEGIKAYALLALRARLQLEAKGLKMSRGPSALSIVRGMGIRARTAKAALPLFENYLRCDVDWGNPSLPA
jgi:hypothetical protein